MTLSVKEICEIIETCGKNRAKSIQLGTLKLSFFSGRPTPNEPAEIVPLTPEQEKEFAEHAARALEENTALIRERDLEEMRLAHPDMYEELVVKGELENARQETDGTPT